MGLWPAIAVTAYLVSLLWALAGDIWGHGWVIETFREWQTLIAGLATVSALFYAGRQLRIERHRDRRAYLQQHTQEWQALDGIEADLDRFSVGKLRVVGALLKRRSGAGNLQINAERWARLNELCVPAIDAPLREYLTAAQMYDAFVRDVDGRSTPIEAWEESLIEGHIARLIDSSRDLANAIAARRRDILALAPEP